MAGWFELGKSKDGQFHFALKGDGDKHLLGSELYKEKASARNGIASVQANCGNDGRYEKKTSTNGKFHFNLKAANGQVIGTSSLFATENERDQAIAAVKLAGLSTDIRDSA